MNTANDTDKLFAGDCSLNILLWAIDFVVTKSRQDAQKSAENDHADTIRNACTISTNGCMGCHGKNKLFKPKTELVDNKPDTH